MSTVELEFAGSGSLAKGDALPRPDGYPILGILPKLKGDQLRYFVDLVGELGDMIELPLGPRKVLMLNHPLAVEQVLQRNAKNYHKSRYYGPLKPILGDGIFLAEDDCWLHQRRAAGTGFQGCQLKRMTEVMGQATEEMLDRWQTTCRRDESLGLVPAMTGVTLDIVLRTLLSYRIAADSDEVMAALTVILREAERRVWSLLPLPIEVPTRRNRQLKQSLAVLDRLVESIVQQRQASGERGEDLLQVLIDVQPDMEAAGMPPSLLRDQVLSIILAGHETTANALSWTFALLSKHPNVRRRVEAELAEVLGGRMPRFDDLHALTYSKQVFLEAMRLYPPVWTLSREAVADDEILGRNVPQGTTVMLCSYAIHRRPEYWPNPEGFDPDRFTPEAQKSRPRHAYFPFGGGPRTCLGERFATLEALIIMAGVLQRFRLDLTPGQEVRPEPMITLRPAGTLPMTLTEL